MIEINKREKKLLTVLGALVGVLVVYYAIVNHVLSFKQNSDKSLGSNISKIFVNKPYALIIRKLTIAKHPSNA